VVVISDEELTADEERARNLIFEKGPEGTADAFRRLAEKCRQKELLQLLLQPVVAAAVFHVTGPVRTVRLIPSDRRQLAAFAKRLRGLAAEIKPLSESHLARLLRLDDLLSFPEKLRAVAKDLDAVSAHLKKKAGRTDWAFVIEQEAVLLDFVCDRMGRPHYPDVATLLEATFETFSPQNRPAEYDGQTLARRRKRLKVAPRPLFWTPNGLRLLLQQTKS
jgi:hypothetical protein